MDPLIENTAERIFADHVDLAVRDRAAAGEFPAALWAALREAGLHLVGSAESGTGLADLFALHKWLAAMPRRCRWPTC